MVVIRLTPEAVSDAVPPGFEPRLAEPKSAVLPLHHGTKLRCKYTIIIIPCKAKYRLQLLLPAGYNPIFFHRIFGIQIRISKEFIGIILCEKRHNISA